MRACEELRRQFGRSHFLFYCGFADRTAGGTAIFLRRGAFEGCSFRAEEVVPSKLYHASVHRKATATEVAKVLKGSCDSGR